jgi:hypothetical protein
MLLRHDAKRNPDATGRLRNALRRHVRSMDGQFGKPSQIF